MSLGSELIFLVFTSRIRTLVFKFHKYHKVQVGNILLDIGFYSTTYQTTAPNPSVRPPRAAETPKMVTDNDDKLGYVCAVANW